MKATRIAYTKKLNQGKLNRLEEIAQRLGKVRSKVWREFGSVSGVGLSDRKIRDAWMKDGTGQTFNVPARLWKETLRDSFGDIITYREAVKVKVRKAIRNKTSDSEEQKRLYTLLKYDRWMEDNFLRRQMRKHFKHGKTTVDNQIVLDSCCYTTFVKHGCAWIDVMSLQRGKRVAIPLNTTVEPSGTLRLIIRDGKIEIHYAIDIQLENYAPCGEKEIGVDKGYTEAFTDSDGTRHGENLGSILSEESDYLKQKYARRNKLEDIAQKKPHKRNKIKQHNLGTKTLFHRKQKYIAHVRDEIFQAAHDIADKACVIVSEDLTSPILSKHFGKNQNRRLSGWVKGTMAEALDTVSQRRRSMLCLVNAAYTSQVDSRYGILMGNRRGDSFYCFDGDVLDADINAARNILNRMSDSAIQLYTPYQQVKQILLERTEQHKRLGLLNQDTSCSDAHS